MSDSRGILVNTPQCIPLGGSFNQLLLHATIDWVSGQGPNVGVFDCIISRVVLWHV